MSTSPAVSKHTTAGGVEIYKLPVWSFENHYTNCYLVLDEAVTLIDCASGIGDANAMLRRAFELARDALGLAATLEDVERLIVTHGHIDHFGGANHVVEASGAQVAIHTLDVSTLRYFESRRIVAAKDLQVYLERSGMAPARVASMLDMHQWSKGLFKPVDVDLVLEEGPVPDSAFHAFHTPGHCPGQVCLLLDDVLFTADHVLDRITPHQSPEFITRNMGLGHYFDALRKIRELDGIRLGLGGHLGDIHDVGKRIDETVAFHQRRLDKTLAICREPRNLAEVSRELFGPRSSYHVLLAILEAGAHVEYLYERGMLHVENYETLEHGGNPVLQYRTV